jgi:hypothetical protein
VDQVHGSSCQSQLNPWSVGPFCSNDLWRSLLPFWFFILPFRLLTTIPFIKAIRGKRYLNDSVRTKIADSNSSWPALRQLHQPIVDLEGAFPGPPVLLDDGCPDLITTMCTIGWPFVFWEPIKYDASLVSLLVFPRYDKFTGRDGSNRKNCLFIEQLNCSVSQLSSSASMILIVWEHIT